MLYVCYTTTTSTKLTVSSHAIYWYISSSAYAHIIGMYFTYTTMHCYSYQLTEEYSPFEESNMSAIKPFAAAPAGAYIKSCDWAVVMCGCEAGFYCWRTVNIRTWYRSHAAVRIQKRIDIQYIYRQFFLCEQRRTRLIIITKMSKHILFLQCINYDVIFCL